MVSRQSVNELTLHETSTQPNLYRVLWSTMLRPNHILSSVLLLLNTIPTHAKASNTLTQKRKSARLAPPLGRQDDGWLAQRTRLAFPASQAGSSRTVCSPLPILAESKAATPVTSSPPANSPNTNFLST